jgi:CheY-like chemotaxis protein
VQVLTNLISNAIKYTPRGKAVLICCTNSGDNVKINVIDQGPGIAEEHMQGLFGLFQQLSCVENEFNTGSGLGLAISKAIVDKLGGSIGAESTFGEGATFWFEVPALEAPKALETAETIESARERSEAEPASILLMEDSDSIALILKTLITRKGYHCARAANIAEAHTLAEAQRPDLLFADINLPDGNGLDFVNWLHDLYAAEAIPVIVLSGAETNTDRVHRPELVDWVKKPFETEEILRLMKLRTKKLPQALDGSIKRN